MKRPAKPGCGAVKDGEHQPCHLPEGHEGSHESIWFEDAEHHMAGGYEVHLWMPFPEPNTLISGDLVAPRHVPG